MMNYSEETITYLARENGKTTRLRAKGPDITGEIVSSCLMNPDITVCTLAETEQPTGFLDSLLSVSRDIQNGQTLSKFKGRASRSLSTTDRRSPTSSNNDTIELGHSVIGRLASDRLQLIIHLSA